MKHAFYSEKAANLYGFIIYINEDNEEIKVTILSDQKDNEGYKWDDTVYVGKVKKFVKSFLKEKGVYLS